MWARLASGRYNDYFGPLDSAQLQRLAAQSAPSALPLRFLIQMGLFSGLLVSLSIWAGGSPCAAGDVAFRHFLSWCFVVQGPLRTGDQSPASRKPKSFGHLAEAVEPFLVRVLVLIGWKLGESGIQSQPCQVARILDTAIDFMTNVIPSMVPGFLLEGRTLDG